uniref:G domain-containing protein n=1 Tax=Steinernema glaseri TaxID=37863 RepID=A0A1I7XYZ6_9BILA
HGEDYVPHADRVFEEIKCEEINVILMGETGAGKSTWIDAIFNYVLFETLDEAVEHNQLEIPIPTHFLIEDDDKKRRKIHVGGKNDNENDQVGASATQRPKTYTFMFHGRFYRFIDVPGVNDSRGIDQDRKNFEMIMRELYNYDRIHAICILIPSDAPRLT